MSDSGTLPVALTIAGSDSCGGAGIQADLKTFQALGVYGMSAITAVTVQNTQKVAAIHPVPAQLVHDQIVCLFDDITIQAVKIGMVASVELIEAIAAALSSVQRPPVVLDPVMIAKSGFALLAADARQALVRHLFPLADVVTPNLHEAEILTGNAIADEAQMRDAARHMISLGARRGVVKGGHLQGRQAVDIVFDGNRFKSLVARRVATGNTHGTGCTFSSAIAAHLARGMPFFQAVEQAKAYVTGAIAHALAIGKGHGPTHHFWDLYARASSTTVSS
ncbi:MAG: bifunctional hydroxymethylpyrimidine kinase/phosphomethylpyrimidine kinase [Desulfatitalea sp.]|nr:bifunctional hydroxymethylpyrimidine kinase/phosphomethylpyrimidine kinase [Desulfatitalea sp.]